MRKFLLLAALIVGVLAAATPTQSQMFGRPKPVAADPSSIDCAALARMPNAPMTQAACEQMIGQAKAMQSAMDDPAGQRPGDAAMTCDEVKAELSTQQNIGVSRDHLAEGQAASADYLAREKRVQAEGAALAARQAAVNTGAAALSLVPGVGAAASTAAAASTMAATSAFGQRANAELTPARRRLSSSTAASMGDVTRSMQDNPRFATLARLAQEKNCR
ncbi:MAG: hypothetical protein Q8M88_10670 [Phenylobacterium sp.]|uniref:hypothetical protein n=1 Tax=Phenylobacterium sp. TaxID=1871053 RepID=UPI0027324F44|nr:hypothetical protein [Phenylobacterium sp.]MDP3174884.1 hypothetical protein [Phenylobacterium sp.]